VLLWHLLLVWLLELELELCRSSINNNNNNYCHFNIKYELRWYAQTKELVMVVVVLTL